MNARHVTTLLPILVVAVAAPILFGGIGSTAGVHHRHDKGAEIDVAVFDDEGDPVRNATVIAERHDGSVASRGTTATSGRATVHLSRADGRYRVRAVLPAGYRPNDDSDGAAPGACGTHDTRLCTTLLTKGGTLSMPGALPTHRDPASVRFDVVDLTPEPRLTVITRDADTKKPLGGVVTIRPVGTPAPKAVRTHSNNGTTRTNVIPAGDYLVTWTPPPKWSGPRDNPRTVSVTRNTTTIFEGTRGPTDTTTMANVYVRDAKTGAIVKGGRVRWWYLGADNKMTTSDGAAGQLSIWRAADFIVKLISPPSGYRTVGVDTVGVDPGAKTTVTFEVERIPPAAAATAEGSSTSAPPTPPTPSPTVPPTPPTPTPSPTAPPTPPTSSPTEEGASDQPPVEDDVSDELPPEASAPSTAPEDAVVYEAPVQPGTAATEIVLVEVAG